MKTFIKCGMYVLSLCLLFIIIIIKQIEVPTSCTISALLKANIIPAICFFLLMFSAWFYFQFDSMTKGSKKGPYKIVKIENANSDYLVFLTSYIIPLIGFELETVRQIIYFSIILIALGLMYIKTNLFYANPTLSLFNFMIYKVNYECENNKPVESGILLTKEKLSLYDEILIINLGNNISYARKAYIRK
jgi:hypothetical protein